MNDLTKDKIKNRIRQKTDGILLRRITEFPSDMANLLSANPFGGRLVPEEIWKGSKFERSFVTSFGQGVYEQIAYEIAIGSGSESQNQHTEIVSLNSWQDEGINNLLSEQRSSKRKITPEWNEELNQIKTLNSPRIADVNTLFDLYIKRSSGQEEYYSIKTVKPNLDQTEIAKRDMLRMAAAKPDCKTFFALPYNPYGEGNKYGCTIPNKLFNMNDSPAVLIGADFWNAVGDNDNTFTELLEIFTELGTEYKTKIQNDYLNL